MFLCIINYVSHQFRDHCEQSIQADWVLNEKEKISCLLDLTLATTSADFRCYRVRGMTRRINERQKKEKLKMHE